MALYLIPNGPFVRLLLLAFHSAMISSQRWWSHLTASAAATAAVAVFALVRTLRRMGANPANCPTGRHR
jgi:Flp pilus assembly protein protease CpaA